jgi:4-amino-4-deoxy-L-arabinose transferase-like glycosyltransferase
LTALKKLLPHLVRPSARSAVLLVLMAFALTLQMHAVDTLPIDYDEDDYMRAGQLLTADIRSGDLAGLTQDNYRPEHPELAKLIYGVALTTVRAAHTVPDRESDAPPALALPQPQFYVLRLTSSLFGLAEIVALGVMSPLAALLLAVNSWQTKYTAEVMLESVPAFLSLLAVLFYWRWRSGGKRRRWLVASGVFLGLAVAGKYLYGVAGLAIVADWLWTSRPERFRDRDGLIGWLRPIGLWWLLAFACFFLADPYLWPDPVGRLGSSILFHLGYAGQHVGTDTPIWQQFTYLFQSVPWSTDSFLFSIDGVVAGLAIAGFGRLWRTRRVFAIWLLIGLVFLLLWPTKWPQYILIITAPLSLSAVEGLKLGISPLTDRLRGPWQPVAAWWTRLCGGDRVPEGGKPA